MKPENQDLDRLRWEIDALDDQLLTLIQKRIRLARKIGRLKRAGGYDIADSRREASILKRLDEQIKPGLSPDQVRTLYAVIFQLCRDVQEPE